MYVILDWINEDDIEVVKAKEDMIVSVRGSKTAKIFKGETVRFWEIGEARDFVNDYQIMSKDGKEINHYVEIIKL